MENKNKTSKKIIFLTGAAGVLFGAILFPLLFFGFFSLVDGFKKSNIDCVFNKETTSGDMKCQILESKDRGNVLKASEMIPSSMYEDELKTIKDRKTSGKFIEVKINLKNNGKEAEDISEMILIDNQNRKYSSWDSGMDFEYWIPSESYFAVGAGLEKDIIYIFEVPQDFSDFKAKLKLFRSSGGMD